MREKAGAAAAEQGVLFGDAAPRRRDGCEERACLRAYPDLQGTIIRVAADPVGDTLGVIERRSLIEVKDTLVIGETIVSMEIEEI